MTTQRQISTLPPRPAKLASTNDDVTDSQLSLGKTETAHITRAHAYSFLLDENGQPIELGSGRFAKAFLGEERWLQSKTAFSRKVAIKTLQRGVSEEDALRFQMEKELLERVQGCSHIITLYASGEADNPQFIPECLRDRVENDFIILELLEMSLEERLKGARNKNTHDNLLAYPINERLFRVLEYMLPVANAVEYAHLVRNVCHRDIKPANVLLRLPLEGLQGSMMEIRLADFNVGKVREESVDQSLTTVQNVPGTLFFQAPEQETNVFELLVNTHQGSREVDYFEDFYMNICLNDTFQIFNRTQRYMVTGVDRDRKKVLLAKPYEEPSESNVRGKIVKSVERPADIYSLGAMFYYLISGAYGNPKSLYDAFHKFIEYEQKDEHNTVDAYIEHEYNVIKSLRPSTQSDGVQMEMAPVDRFFSYKHYLDGNSDLLPMSVIKIIAKAMIRNKPDSYCQSWDVSTDGISKLVVDLQNLYYQFGFDQSVRPTFFHMKNYRSGGFSKKMISFWDRFISRLKKTKPPKPPKPPKTPKPPPVPTK